MVEKTHCGFVAVLGIPNVGKSTLLNQLVGSKISITSPKVQTTRRRVLGITIHDMTQIVFIDTPGLFEPHKRLQKAMVRAAWRAKKESDVLMIVSDATHHHHDKTIELLDKIEFDQQPVVLVINKIDLVTKEELLPQIQLLTEGYPFKKIFLVSAINGDGCQDILEYLAQNLPDGPWLYPADQMTDLPIRLLAAEITREQIYHFLHQELPYAVHVETEEWEEFNNESIKISQVIHVERDNQKAIVLGKGGHMIKQIGARARQELKQLMNREVHLKLYVKVSKNWSENPEFYKDIGLEFNA
jgi:GTP-binding protein Era